MVTYTILHSVRDEVVTVARSWDVTEDLIGLSQLGGGAVPSKLVRKATAFDFIVTAIARPGSSWRRL